MTIKEMLEKRAELAAKIKEFADKADRAKKGEGEWAADDQANWEKLNADYDELTSEIDAEERKSRLHKIDGDLSRKVGADPARKALGLGDEHFARRGPLPGVEVTEEKKLACFRSWFKRQSGFDLSEEEQEACHELRFDPRQTNLDIRLYRRAPTMAEIRAWPDSKRQELRALGHTSTAGLELVPEGFVATLERSLLMFGGMRQTSEILRTDSGNDLPWPTTNDTGNKGAILAENVAVSEQDVAFSSVVLQAFKYTSKLVRVSQELIEDSAFNLAEMLGEMLGERIARIENEHFTTGDGSSKPRGIVTASGLGVTAASATAITADEVISLFYSVDPAYRNQPGAGWQMKDATVAVIRKLKGSDNNYLWQPGLQAGQPDLLLGQPITTNQDIAAITNSAKTIVYGSQRKYKIRDVRMLRLRRMVERYGDFDQEGFVAFHRSDGDLLDAGTDPVKHLIQAV